MAGMVWGDEVVEAKLGPSDMLFRNDGMSDAQFTMGSGRAYAATRRLRRGVSEGAATTMSHARPGASV